MAKPDTKARDIKNLNAAIAYNEAHVKDHQQHLDKMQRKKTHVDNMPLQPVGKKGTK